MSMNDSDYTLRFFLTQQEAVANDELVAVTFYANEGQSETKLPPCNPDVLLRVLKHNILDIPVFGVYALGEHELNVWVWEENKN